MTDRHDLLHSTIDDLIARYPSTIHVLNAYGIDTCCGGSATLEEAALQAHLKPGVLLATIESVTQPGATQP